jgi:hypothetical protein
MTYTYTLNADGFSVNADIGDAKLWLDLSFAKSWYDDAVEQSRLPNSRDAMRREIIFAVCAAESYLLEWVRDAVLNRKHDELPNYFPANRKVGVQKRWKAVVKQVAKDRNSQSQRFNSGIWNDFCTLVDFRDGLVHGSASRPQEAGQHKDLQPYPPPAELDRKSPGWAVGVVRALIEDLHRAAGTTPQKWLSGDLKP